ncbi:MAG: radical SAM protein [Nanoarchaeota archaeon]
MKYKEAIKTSMEALAKEENTIFLGYNICFGTKAYGTLTDVPREKMIETPLAENLMAGLAIGLSLEGYFPVLFFERHDFMLIALDAIVNHLDKMEKLSHGEYKAPMIIRAVVGGTKPLYPGIQHTQDFTEAFKKMINFPIYEPKNSEEVIEAYKKAKESGKPAMIIERKDLYETEAKKKELILDGHKLFWHKERVEAWLKGERVAPITIDCALTRRCNYKCMYCYGKLQENDEKRITKEVIFRFLDDAAEIGVKGVSFVSDGESTCSPYLYDAIVHGKKKGLDMALGTNGALLKKEKLKEILPCLTYIRFNFSAGEAKRYAEIMGCREEDFYNVCEIIKECVKIKKEANLDVTIGLQMVLMPSFIDQIMPLAKLGKDLGADYSVIKHCSDDEEGHLGIEYEQYFNKKLIEELERAEALSNENYTVKAKWSKILSGGKRKYTRCYGPPFILQLSGSGLVAPCGMLFNDKYKKFHIGNIAEKSFKEIWQSDKYWEVMKMISSNEFNAKEDCGTLCLQHKVNEYLWDLKENNITTIPEPEGEKPAHINFI